MEPILESKEEETNCKCEIIQLTLKSTWEYDVSTDLCAICKNPLTFFPPDYEENGKIIGNFVSLGKCEHPFHNSCISNWLKKNDTCPTCFSVFSYELNKLDNPKWKEEYSNR